MSIAEKLTAIAENEQKVYDAGFKAGQATGGSDGFYDAFWDNYQDNGNRVNYRYAFYRTYWNDQNFKPKYDIVPSGDGQYVFQQCGVTDMKGILEQRGVRLDFSKTPSLYHCFNSASVTRLPVIDGTKCTAWQNAFVSCKSLVSIDKVVVTEKVTGVNFAQMFGGCSALESVIFEGVINADISVGESPLLSHDSIISLLNVLKEGGAGTVTLGETNLAKLTDAEKAIATEKGWTLV